MLPHFHEVGSDAARGLIERVETSRLQVSRRLDTNKRSALGQFLTPWEVARFMASLFKAKVAHIRVLDAGAGAGSLFAAFVAEICSRHHRPKNLSVTAYEVDAVFDKYLKATVRECHRACRASQVEFAARVLGDDFIRAGAEMLGSELFVSRSPRFNCAILNPPYHKISSDSQTRRLLRAIGIETSNLYSAFLAIAVKLLEPGGELVAITPRSFCNGPYFRPFRREFLRQMNIRRIHVFTSRERAFRDDEVLQENVIIRAVKERRRTAVVISSNDGPDDPEMRIQRVDYTEVVRPEDSDAFIRIAPNEYDTEVRRKMRAFTATLEDIGISVSTGRVVDFRARRCLRPEPGEGSVPLIYPCHFQAGYVTWPKAKGNKPNAIARATETENLLIPSSVYVLVKRFSTKEERRRVVAAIYDPSRVATDVVGFENHLNYFHRHGRGLCERLAKGLAIYLNSSLVDLFFRQFNGHTQVNAADLRNMKYPTTAQLEAVGSRVGKIFPSQEEIDAIIEREVQSAAKGRETAEDLKRKDAH